MTLTQTILARDNYTCAYCRGRARTIDHLFSKAEGRRQDIERDNEAYIVACCLNCNLLRGTRRLLPPSWADRLPAIEEFTNKKWRVWRGDRAGLQKVIQ